MLGTDIGRDQRQVSLRVPKQLAVDIELAMKLAPIKPTISAFLEELVRRGLNDWCKEFKK